MASSHRYEAFISYSHVDKAAAVRLHQALERLKIPKHLAQTRGLPGQRFRPLFRDEDELTSSTDLPETLRDALKDSRNLIVVCSPAAAGSQWVDQEVRAFSELGDPRRIFCVLVDGNAQQPDECFPPSLLSGSVPLAVDLRPEGEKFRIGVLRIAAGLLEVGFDELRQRARSARNRRIALQSTLTVAALALVATLTFRLAVTPPCTTSAEQLAGIWNPQAEETIRNAFTATGLPYADTMFDRVVRRLQRYHDGWADMHTESCAATLVRSEQSPQLMDLRMACLDERRAEFASMIDLLENADADLVENAVSRIGQLGTLDRCADAEQLQAVYPLPDDPAQRGAISSLSQTTADANAAITSGRLDRARELLEGLVESAQAIDYPALSARAMLASARLQRQQGNNSAARETIYEAAAKAVLARDTELVAEAWLTLPESRNANKDELDEAIRLLVLAQSYVAQLPANHPLEAEFHATRGHVLMEQGNLEEGIRDFQAAVAIGRQIDSTELGPLLTSLAGGLTNLHAMDEADTVADEALTVTRQDFGTDHPVHARALAAAAGVQSALGNRDEALSLMEQAVRIEEDAFAGASPRLAHSLQRLGWTYNQSGRYQQAIDTFERTIVMEQTFAQPNWGNVAAAYNDMGDTYISLGNYDAARDALEASLKVWQDQERVTNIGIALGNLGNTSNRVGRFAEAEEYCRAALANDAGYLAPDHPLLAYPLTCIGEAMIGKGNPEGALIPLEQAHSLRDQIDIDEASLAWTRWLYGRALVESARDAQLGRRYVIFARDTFAGMPNVAASELSDVEAWLSQQDEREP